MSKHRHLDVRSLPKEVERLRDFLKARVIGQPLAIDRIVSSFAISLTPLKTRHKPVFVGLFLGPSGVGKTETAERLSEFFFEDRNGRIKISCSELSESFQVSRLIGSPPGYVGYYDEDRGKGDRPTLHQERVDEAGMRALAAKVRKEDPETADIYKRMLNAQNQLNNASSSEEAKHLRAEFEKLKRIYEKRIDHMTWNKDPISIILFDEIEKADPAIHMLLLEIASKGILTMSNGEETRFDQSFIILTSNIGSYDISDMIKGKGRPGFVSSQATRDVYQTAMDALKKELPPELIGRIKENIVVFRPLGTEELRKILDLRLWELRRHVTRETNIVLRIGNKLREFLFSKACDHPEYGARLIEDKINHYLLEPLARLMGTNQIDAGDVIIAEYSTNDSAVVFYKDKKPQEDFPVELFEGEVENC